MISQNVKVFLCKDLTITASTHDTMGCVWWMRMQQFTVDAWSGAICRATFCMLFLELCFLCFFIYLFLPPLSKLTEEQGKLFSPLLENCASSEGCSFSWRRGSSSLPWECQDHSEKRALSYLFGSHAQTHTSMCADRQGCKNIHHREIQSFSGLKNILELCDGGPVRRIQEANLTQKNHATLVPRCEHF